MRLGATNETTVIRNRVYKAGYYTAFCRVVVLAPGDSQYVPDRLAGLQVFHAKDLESYQGLLTWLRGPADAKQVIAAGRVAWPEERPGFEWNLADRTPEFQTFQGIVTGRCAERVFLIRGDGNRGKTVLLAELLSYSQHQGLLRILSISKGARRSMMSSRTSSSSALHTSRARQTRLLQTEVSNYSVTCRILLFRL
jgi:hypothetical protein